MLRVSCEYAVLIIIVIANAFLRSSEETKEYLINSLYEHSSTKDHLVLMPPVC